MTFCVLFAIASSLAQNLLSQSIEGGWKGIKPLITSKTDVEKTLGKPSVIDDNGYYGYRTEEAFIQINYSTAPCKKNQYNRGKFMIAANTVLSYDVHMKKELTLSDLTFDKYYKDTSGDVINVWTYYNRDYSIGVTVGTKNGEDTEYVGTIRFAPPKAEAEKLKCSGIE